jgi:hypothetical protein
VTIVDSTVWVDYFRGRATAQTAWLDQHAATNPIGLTDLIATPKKCSRIEQFAMPTDEHGFHVCANRHEWPAVTTCRRA